MNKQTKPSRRIPKAANPKPKITPSPPVGGRVARILGPAQDITERVQAPDALQKSEERYRLLSNSMTEGFALYELIFDENGKPCDYRFLDVNQAFEQLTGLKREALIGKVQREILPEEDLFWFKKYCKVALNGESIHLKHYSPLLQRHYEVYAYCPAPNHFAVVFTDITERAQAQEVLREYEEHYCLFQEILQSSSDGILAVNRENEVLFTNERFVEMWMIPQEMMAKKDDTLLLQYVLDQLSDSQGFLQKVQELYNSSEESFDTLYFKDGRVFERLSRPLMQGTELRGRVWSFRDITKQKRVEEALRESEERHRSLFDRMLDGVYRSTHDGKFVDVNPAMVKMFGYSSKEEMLEVDIKNELYFAPEERGSHILDTGREEVDVYRMRRKDGSEIWVEDHGFYVHDEQGRVIYHVGMMRDITERKQAEDAVQNSEKRLRALIENGRDNISLLAADGTLLWENPSTVRTLGYAPDQFVGRNLFGLIHPDDKDAARNMLVQIARKQGNSQEGMFRLLHGEGSWRWIEATVTNLLHEPSVQAIVINYRDITERKQAETLREVLMEIMQGGVTTKELQDFLGLVHRSIDKVIYAENFFVVLYNKDADWFEEAYSVDKFDPPGPPSRDKKSISAYIIRTGRPLLLNDEQVFSELVAQGEVELVGTNSPSWMGVPLKTSKETIGVMVVQDYDAPNRYSERDLEVLASIAGQVALVVERRRAEEALAASEAELRALFASMHDAVLVIDREGVYRKIAPTNPGMLVKPPEELLGKNLRDVFPAEQAEAFRGVMQRVLDTKQNTQIEYELIIGGRTVWFQTTISPLNTDSTLWVAHDITRRKQAEKALRTAEANYRSIFENATIGIYQSAPQGRFLSVNPVMARILGYDSPEELLNSIVSIEKQYYADPAVRHKVQRLLMEQGEVREFISQNRRKDGGYIWIQENARAVKDANGSILHYEGFITDITERKQAEEALRESEDRYRDLVENSQELICTHDLEGRILSANPWAVKVLGYEMDTILQMNMRDFLAPEVRGGFETYLAKIQKRGAAKGLLLIQTATGERRIWEYNNTLRTEGVAVPVVRGMARDITERKQAEEALRTAEANYRSIFENSTIGIYQSTPQGCFLRVNPVMARIFGYDSPEDMLNSIFSIEKQYYVDPADRLEFQRLLMEQGEVREFISHNRRKDGRHIWARENARAVKDANGNILHYEGFVTDITERKQAEEELRRAKDELETANLELQQSLEREKLLACTDGLTGLYNHRHFFELAAHEFHAAVRHRRPLTFLMFDMDDFKQVNDTLGHSAGDKLLVMVAQVAVAQVRVSDVVARYGGDEFIVMLPQASAQQALPIAERIRASVAALRVDVFRDDKEPFVITLSIGIAEMWHEPVDENVERVIQHADEAMYKAKQSGRNRIVIFGQDETGAT